MNIRKLQALDGKLDYLIGELTSIRGALSWEMCSEMDKDSVERLVDELEQQQGTIQAMVKEARS